MALANERIEHPTAEVSSAKASKSSDSPVSIRVWDLPLRLFHWLLLAAVSVAIATGLAGGEWMTWHGRAGLGIVGLLAFRLVWGLVGSTTSRFGHFAPTPARLRAYFGGAWQRIGHNPLGALSVFALLGLLALQVGTGLFSNDDIAFAGPLSQLVDEALVSELTGWHHRLINLLYGLIGLHGVAIAFHSFVKRDRLVPAMVTGKKVIPPGVRVPQGTSRARPAALVLAVALAAGATWLASGAWIPAAAPAASTPAPTPSW